jgi:hypothetical protein
MIKNYAKGSHQELPLHLQTYHCTWLQSLITIWKVINP